MNGIEEVMIDEFWNVFPVIVTLHCVYIKAEMIDFDANYRLRYINILFTSNIQKLIVFNF